MTYDRTNTADESFERHGSRYSRRALLGAGGAGLASVVAGCSSLDSSGSPSGSSAPDSEVFTDISFEGQQMVVGLREGHSVERLNLIGPDGGEYTSEGVSRGVESVRMSIMDISPGLSGYEHYPPGQFTLIAATEEDSHRKVSFAIDPSIKIVSISAVSIDDSGFQDRLKVMVKNTGTGPTWIYDIVYSNLEAGRTSTAGEMAGLPKGNLQVPQTAEGSILDPGESQAFVSREKPFIFKSESICQESTLSGKVIAVSPVDTQSERAFKANLNGGATSTDPSTNRETYYCNSVSASLINEMEDVR